MKDFFFTTRQGTLRAVRATITDQVKAIFLGEHNHMLIENLGANPIFLSASTQSNPEQWLEPLSNKSLDGYQDQKIFLSCGVGLTAVVLITLWQGKEN